MDNPGNTEFRKAFSEDIPVLKNLIEKLYKHENIIYSDADIQYALQKLIENEALGTAWFIIFNSTIAGYIIIASAFSIEFKGETAFIDELYIHEQFRGKGLGRKAVMFAEEFGRSKGYHAIRLEVELNNETAHNVYKNAGFTVHERYIMTKWLK